MSTIRLTATLSLEYDPADGIVTTPEDAEQDFFDCLHTFGPRDFTLKVEEVGA